MVASTTAAGASVPWRLQNQSMQESLHSYCQDACNMCDAPVQGEIISLIQVKEEEEEISNRPASQFYIRRRLFMFIGATRRA